MNNNLSPNSINAPPDLFPDTLNPLFGRMVELDSPCPQCTGQTAIIRDGRAMHAATLVCAGCGRFCQWISHASFNAIQKFVSEIADRFGAPEVMSFRAITRGTNPEPCSNQKEDSQVKKQSNKPGRGALFKANQKNNENSPDYYGSCNIDGTEYQVSGWIKTRQREAATNF